MDGRIRVFLLDDHELVRRGVAAMLAADDGIEIVGEASSVAEALARIPVATPDVAVLDVRLPDGSGIDVCREVRSTSPQVRCIMLTSLEDDRALFDAMAAGASAYLLKQLRGMDLAGAVRSVAAGHSLLDPLVALRLADRYKDASSTDELVAVLTNQERRVMRLIGEGLSNCEIAAQLLLGENTVKNYVSNVLAKMEMHRRSQVVVYAAKLPADDLAMSGRHPRRAVE